MGRVSASVKPDAEERLRNNYSLSFTPHPNPLPCYSLRGGGEETNVEVISELFLREPEGSAPGGDWRRQRDFHARRARYTWETMAKTVFERIELLLKSADISYDVSHHEAVFTSEQAARVRGVPLATGAKALVCKGESGFLMFVMPADRRLDSRRVRQSLGYRRLRFANREEVLQLTGLTPGSIPPFGSLFELPTYCDERLGDHEKINFNAGDHCVTVSMRFADYVRVEKPVLGMWAD